MWLTVTQMPVSINTLPTGNYSFPGVSLVQTRGNLILSMESMSTPKDGYTLQTEKTTESRCLTAMGNSKLNG